MQPNQLKSLLKNGGVAYGTFTRFGSGAAVEILGYAGFDFVVIDMEHGPFGYETALELARAARSVGMSSVVRVPENRPAYIMRALDIGADGVQVPQVESGEAARMAAGAAHYHPEGYRGVCRFTRAAQYSSISAEEHFRTSNQEVLTVVHIEGKEAAREAEAIATTPGVDVVFIGPYDLSQSMGLPGQVNHPDVVAAIDSIIKTCRRHGVVIGTFADTVETAAYWVERGAQYITLLTDVGILTQSCQELVKSLKAIRPGGHAQ